MIWNYQNNKYKYKNIEVINIMRLAKCAVCDSKKIKIYQKTRSKRIFKQITNQNSFKWHFSFGDILFQKILTL